MGEHTLSLSDFDWNGRCAGGAAGIVRYRGDGYWYTLDFGEACTGCADVAYHIDDALGDACLDLSPAMEELVRQLAAPTDPLAGPRP